MKHSEFVASILQNFDHEPQACRVIDVGSQKVSRTFFKKEVLNSNVPVLLKGGIPQNLLQKWNAEKLVDHLKSQDGILWVIRGSAEQGGTNLVEISVKDYLSYLENEQKREEETEPLYVTISNELMQMLPDMAKEFEVKKLLPFLYSCDTYAFLGPDKTVTGLHADTYHSLFYQVWGHKFWILVPPSNTPDVYLSEKYEWSTRLSRVDLKQVEYNRAQYPFIRRCKPVLVEVNTGDILWVPVGWFHYVYSTKPSFSISFFLANFFRTITYAVWEDWIKTALHNAGLYGRKNGCTCHPTGLKNEPF
jgi:ribosomal protein L16 Arg81 hydroxylase